MTKIRQSAETAAMIEVVIGAVAHVLVRRRGTAEVDLRGLERGSLDRLERGVLDLVDVRDSLRRRGIALMGDDEPHRFSVGRDELLEAPLEVGVVEDLRRQIERVVDLGVVEGSTNGIGVRLLPVLQALLTLLRRVVGHDLIAVGFLAGDLRREQREQLGLQRVDLVEAGCGLPEQVGQFVDAVQRVEERPDRVADRDVVAVRFPVEVIPDGPEEVVEVRDLVPQVVGHRHRLFNGRPVPAARRRFVSAATAVGAGCRSGWRCRLPESAGRQCALGRRTV